MLISTLARLSFLLHRNKFWYFLANRQSLQWRFSNFAIWRNVFVSWIRKYRQAIYQPLTIIYPFEMITLSKHLTITLFRCSTDITGQYKTIKCQGGSCTVGPCRLNKLTGLYNKECVLIPQKQQIAKASIMFAQSIESVSTLFFSPRLLPT